MVVTSVFGVVADSVGVVPEPVGYLGHDGTGFGGFHTPGPSTSPTS
jgi:hypothetical protein